MKFITKFSMQITVPHSEYGACNYFIPQQINEWLFEQGPEYAHYCGVESSGDGYTNGVTNKASVYMVRSVREEDGLAFKLMFPKCKVHMSQCDD